jgi:hypothetical protein
VKTGPEWLELLPKLLLLTANLYNVAANAGQKTGKDNNK